MDGATILNTTMPDAAMLGAANIGTIIEKTDGLSTGKAGAASVTAPVVTTVTTPRVAPSTGVVERTVLHVDMNNFFASVECRGKPELARRPVAVCGSVEDRHGIVLAKNMNAKGYGVQTGEPIFEAKRKCPSLVILEPHYDEYIAVSRAARELYGEYTDRIESFGIDECWLDVTGSGYLFGDGQRIADELREKVKSRLGVTVSVGVSFNKVFAKLGSDMRKPDATTVITRDNFERVVWPLPVSDLLFVGRATALRLWYLRILTVGDLAAADPDMISRYMGKCGVMLQNFARGLDSTPVLASDLTYAVKSVGNSTTSRRDLVSERDVEIVLAVLCESVATRLRGEGKRCTTVKLSVRGTDLKWYERQCRVVPTALESEIYKASLSLFRANHDGSPIRSIGVCGSSLVPEKDEQLSIFDGETTGRARRELLERTADAIRQKYGHSAIRRALMLEDRVLSDFYPADEHTVHPIGIIG